jgi:hypothetical protein
MEKCDYDLEKYWDYVLEEEKDKKTDTLLYYIA